MGVSHPLTLKFAISQGKKRQYNVFLQGNLLHPGLFDQQPLLTKKVTDKLFAG